MEHNHYEKELKNGLKKCIQNGEAAVLLKDEQTIHFGNLQELISYVERKHADYLRKVRTIEEDIRYILSVCLQVVRGMFELCMSHGNFEFTVA